MSSTYSNNGAWTDDEIACGLPGAVSSGYWAGEEPLHSASPEQSQPTLSKPHNFIATIFELKLSKSVYPLKNHLAVEQKIVREFIQYGINIAIRRYGRIEKLPRRYQLMAQNQDCLLMLLRDFFVRVEQITITPEMDQRFVSIINTLQKKNDREIAYERVGELRNYIHHEVNLMKGEGHALLCDREEMRILLSTARLHLSINELVKHHSLDLIALQKRYISMAAIEANMPTPNTLPGKKNIQRWRLRHYRSLLYYFPIEVRRALMVYMQRQGSFACRDTYSINEYKKELVAYFRKCIEGYLNRIKY